MEHEIGIACGACDVYSPLGTGSCPQCGHVLRLERGGAGTGGLPQLFAETPSAARLAAARPSSAPEEDEPPPSVTVPEPQGRVQEAPPLSVPPPPPPPAEAAAEEYPAQEPPTVGEVPRARTPRPFEAAKPTTQAPPKGVLGMGVPRPGAAPVGSTMRPAGGLPAGASKKARSPGRPAAPDLPLQPEPQADASPYVSHTRLPALDSDREGSANQAESSPTPTKKSSYAHLSKEELMLQAKNYLCTSCQTPVPTGHKFCGRCGTEVPPEILAAGTEFFSEMQNPNTARLILIRGEGMDGLSFHLKMEQHVVGRRGQIEFPEDPFVSPRHANFFYRNQKLFARDEGSLNGVFLRVRGSVEVTPGDVFLAGEQVFRVQGAPTLSDGAGSDGTYFYSSPKHPSPFRITQILEGGSAGMTVCARSTALQLGREGGDLNFPSDIYMSGAHCRVESADGKLTLTDLNSRNGTYIRLKSERQLGHGDYLFIGRKLLRVEMNS